ncbi:MAG: L-histidine N(alpha)-methyltransferase [Candidatus Nitrosocosmicus sp.]|nr:L-histidine N(alpha)-methyltransferase [Candidatus Nitrosocosmicus sp.]
MEVNSEEFGTDTLKGLSNPIQKSIPSKYLYDSKGSFLFEQITVQPEYYPTRTENSILEEYSPEILQIIPKEIILIEMGSGSSKKTKHLFDSILKRQDKLYYFPIDISFNFLDSVVTDLETQNQNIMIKGIPNDYINGIKDCNNILFENNFKFDSFSRLIIFFGSSIGNFEIDEARDFLKAVRINMNDKDFLLVGFDMIKDECLIEPAYNDKAGFTAQFNLNLLTRMNRELGCNFDLNEYVHYAFFNKEKDRIEMHLKSKSDQEFRISGSDRIFQIYQGETIHTESSYKYNEEKIHELAIRSGFSLERIFSDNNNWFNLVLLKPC